VLFPWRMTGAFPFTRQDSIGGQVAGQDGQGKGPQVVYHNQRVGERQSRGRDPRISATPPKDCSPNYTFSAISERQNRVRMAGSEQVMHLAASYGKVIPGAGGMPRVTYTRERESIIGRSSLWSLRFPVTFANSPFERSADVRLFEEDQTRAVQSLFLKMVNNNCPELVALMEGPRLDKRVHLTMVALVVPVERGRPMVEKTFSALTKEFSTTGLGLVVNRSVELEEVLVGLQWENEMTFLQATVRHTSEMGGGFWQLGLQATGRVHTTDYPALKMLHL
jgi:hypothetical protein